jgi:hypothetical protein
MEVEKMRITAFVLLASLLIVPSAFADDTAFGGSGSAPTPIGQPDIEMVSEKVVINGHDVGDERGEGRWNVSCDFTFKNTSDKPIELKVGFPFPVREEDGAVSIPKGRKAGRGDPLVYDFKVSVNGKPVMAKRTKIKANIEKGQYYRDAYIWNMKFAPNETVKVHHDYVTGVTWDVMGYSWASYVLKTGGNWKGGRIGSARIEVIPNALVRLCNKLEKDADWLVPKPKGLKVVGKGKDKKFVWDLKRYKPDDDLHVCMQTAGNYAIRKILFPVVMYGDVEEEMAKLSPERLRLLRNTVYARHGRTFKDPALQKHFDKQWWYVSNPAYSDSMLTKQDREIVAFIRKEEARRSK